MNKLFIIMAAACSVFFSGPAPLHAAQPRNSGRFVFSVASDIHCDSFNKEAQDKFSRAISDAESAGARAMLVAGDSSDGQDNDYKTVRALVSASPLAGAVLFSMGNHEYYRAFHDATGAWNSDTFPNGHTDAEAKRAFNSFRGAAPGAPVYYDEWVGGYHFIFLAGEHSRMADTSYRDDAVLSPEQLAWLKKQLDASAPGEPVFVMLHQPFAGTVAGSSDGEISIRPAAELKAILASRPGVIVFSGHSHYTLSLPGTYYADASYGFHMFNCSSVWQPWADGKALPGDRSEGFIVSVEKGTVTVQGRDFAGSKFIDGQTYVIKTGIHKAD